MVMIKKKRDTDRRAVFIGRDGWQNAAVTGRQREGKFRQSAEIGFARVYVYAYLFLALTLPFLVRKQTGNRLAEP